MDKAQHIIEILSPYNPIAKVLWVLVDGSRRVPLFCDADGIDAVIARLHEQLEEEDRRREEEERERPKRYSKLRLYAALAQAGLWDALRQWLEGQTVDGLNAWTAFSLAQELTSDHPMFAGFLAAAQASLSVDDATVAAILKEAEVEG